MWVSDILMRKNMSRILRIDDSVKKLGVYFFLKNMYLNTKGHNTFKMSAYSPLSSPLPHLLSFSRCHNSYRLKISNCEAKGFCVLHGDLVLKGVRGSLVGKRLYTSQILIFNFLRDSYTIWYCYSLLLLKWKKKNSK